MKKKDLSLDQTVKLAETFGLMADKTRLSIIIICMRQEIAVGEIAAMLGCSTSLTSHHLRHLRVAGILKARRCGKQIFYSLAEARLNEVLSMTIERKRIQLQDYKV